MNSFKFYSHPDKLYIDHIIGIVDHYKDNDINDSVIFHDTGKIISGFRKRVIDKEYADEYSNHSNLSVYFYICAILSNYEFFKEKYNIHDENELKIIVNNISNIIIGHHTHLRNINSLFVDSESNKMLGALNEDNTLFDKIEHFFSENKEYFKYIELKFNRNINNNYKDFSNLDVSIWKKDALNNYYNTIFEYSDLIHGDRRDASDNSEYLRKNNKLKTIYSLENNLEWILNNFKSNNELNKIRTEIRLSADSELKKILVNNSDARIFTLTAPTGSGKTLMLLKLALSIIKHRNYQHDIIYALPYLSIIDQTIDIVNNDLRIETLNYTSNSDTTAVLQRLLNENCDDNIKNILELTFSENTFDHPFVITTFNQLFETLLNNKPSKLLKLKNFEKRIILIDEFQSIPPAQYYFMHQLLGYFCKRLDSYAIISTATMPYFSINALNPKNINEALELFKNPIKSFDLLSDDIFNNNIFNRYNINFIGEITYNVLADKIKNKDKSILLVLNTIKSTYKIYKLLLNNSNFDKIYLLNGHQTSNDCKIIIQNMKNDLINNKKILCITTQKIEAGVDIDFPEVYSDLCPIPSLSQRAGRGNRNGKYSTCDIIVFLLINEKGSYDCKSVYEETITSMLINLCKSNKIFSEIEFHEYVKNHFKDISSYVEVGAIKNNVNIIDLILHGKFEDIGNYQFIENDIKCKTIFALDDDKLWYEFEKIYTAYKDSKKFSEKSINKIHLLKIKKEIIKNSISINENWINILGLNDIISTNNIFGVYNLLNKKGYNNNCGLFPLYRNVI